MLLLSTRGRGALLLSPGSAAGHGPLPDLAPDRHLAERVQAGGRPTGAAGRAAGRRHGKQPATGGRHCPRPALLVLRAGRHLEVPVGVCM